MTALGLAPKKAASHEHDLPEKSNTLTRSNHTSDEAKRLAAAAISAVKDAAATAAAAASGRGKIEVRTLSLPLSLSPFRSLGWVIMLNKFVAENVDYVYIDILRLVKTEVCIEVEMVVLFIIITGNRGTRLCG